MSVSKTRNTTCCPPPNQQAAYALYPLDFLRPRAFSNLRPLERT